MKKLFSISIKSVTVLTLCLGSLSLTRCGQSGKNDHTDSPRGKVESAFDAAAQKYNVNSRVMIAVAYVESHLQSKKMTATYSIQNSDQTAEKSMIVGQTAFGLSRTTLDLKDEDQSDLLTTQIDAYAKYIQEKTKNLKFNQELYTPEQKIRWIWEVSKLHRPGNESQKDLRSIFVREVMAVLNKGFEVKIALNPSDSLETFKFDKEKQALTEELIPSDMYRALRLTTTRGEIRPAYLMNFNPSATARNTNKPRGIIVIHCPFSVSVCLEMQKSRTDNEPRLGAHYIIPQNTEIVSGMIQVALHKEAVPFLNEKGELGYTQDAIVIMLAGPSGNVNKGLRNPVNPEWLTSDQLKLLGQAINLICENLSDTSQVDADTCKSVTANNQSPNLTTRPIIFQHQKSDFYAWGDIPDFDESIFFPYVTEGGSIQGETSLKFASPNRQYNAGETIQFSLQFPAQTKRVEIERLIRCANNDGKIIWENMIIDQVRNETSKMYQLKIFDAGPNDTGEQFIRGKVFGDHDGFLGWSIDHILINQFETSKSQFRLKSCGK